MIMKVALIAIAKREELYIKEWINYHLSKGFDTLIIADNDDELILEKYNSTAVKIEDYTKVEGVQTKAYTELFAKYRYDYDWIFFCDIDEFFVTEDGSDVKSFLSSLPQVDMIRVNCKHFTDNDELDVVDGNYNVFDRFKTPISVDNDRFCKSFLNTKIDVGNRKICGHGLYDKNLKAVDAEGNPCAWERKTEKALLRTAWVNHYRTKTIGEYIRQKYDRGGANRNPHRYSNWEMYFKVTNTLTQEKIDYANKIIADKNNTISNKLKENGKRSKTI